MPPDLGEDEVLVPPDLGEDEVLITPDLLEQLPDPGDNVCWLEDDGDLAGLARARRQPLPTLAVLQLCCKKKDA